MEKLAVIRKQRAAAHDQIVALAEKDDFSADDEKSLKDIEAQIKAFDLQSERIIKARGLAVETAEEVDGQEAPQHPGRSKTKVFARVEDDPYVSDSAAVAFAKKKGFREGTAKSIVFGAVIKMAAAGSGNLFLAIQSAKDIYGEGHPVTKALVASVGTAGGFIVPPDYVNEIIELLRPMTVVRSSNPRVIPMPRGTMTLPSQTSPATAFYQAEATKITPSQQTFGQIVASYKKLVALTPVSNDMMRYADPAVDAVVRDDMVQVIALREDLAFMFGDGTQDTPRGYTSFANEWVKQQGGTIGSWLVGANSTWAVDGAAGSPLVGANGGNFITSTPGYTLATVAAELGGMVNKLDTANVPDMKRVWFMHPRSKNYLYNVQNSLGVYVYRDEMKDGKLLGYPFKCSTQVPLNIQDPTGTYTTCSFVILAEMNETMILDSMSLELAVTREGSYTDAGGNVINAFSNDLTLIRAIAEHDFQMRHPSAVAVNQGVLWAPAIA